MCFVNVKKSFRCFVSLQIITMMIFIVLLKKENKMANKDIAALGEALSRLGIKYRVLPCKSGEFYFCTAPEKKLTFDIQYEENGLLRLWRFIGAAPVSKAGKRWEYRAVKYPSAVVGMKVTDEGDVSFYAEQKVDITDPQSAARIDGMISGYMDLSADPSLALAL